MLKNNLLQKTDSPLLLTSRVCVLFSIVSLIFFTLITYRARFHSDAATAGMIAIEQWRTANLFVRGWYYSQDFWPMFVLNSVTLLFPIIKDAFLATQIGVLFQTIVILIVTRSILKTIQSPVMTNAVLAFLLSGISSLWGEFFYGQGQYGNVLMLLLVAVWLILKVLGNDVQHNPKKLLLALFLINTYANTTSIRYLPLLVFPALVAISYFSYHRILPQKKMGWLAAILISSSVVGQLIFLWLKKEYLFLSGVDGSSFASYAQILSENIPRVIEGYLTLIIDNPSGIKFASLQGVFFLYRFMFCMIFFSIPFYFIFSKSKLIFLGFDGKKQFLIIYFFALAFISFFSVTFLSSTVNSIAAGRYIMVSIYFGVFTGLIYADFLNTYRNKVVFLGLLIPIIFYNAITLNLGFNKGESEREQLAKFLVEHKLEKGFASYWNADVLTVLSNYQVMVSHIELNGTKPSLFMSTKEFYKPSGEKENFLLLDATEVASFDFNFIKEFIGEPARVLNFKGYRIYIYPDEFASRLPGW